MSIKIYEAYRMTPEVFENTFVPAFKKKAFERALRVFGEQISLVESSPSLLESEFRFIYDTKGWSEKTSFDDFKKDFDLSVKISHAAEQIYEASYSMRKDFELDIDASTNVFLYKGYFYVIPYSNIGEVFNLKGVEDYSYWTNSDSHPKNITRKDWEKRGIKWQKICIEDHNRLRLEWKVISCKENIGVDKVLKTIMQNLNTSDERIMYITFKLNSKEKIDKIKEERIKYKEMQK